MPGGPVKGSVGKGGECFGNPFQWPITADIGSGNGQGHAPFGDSQQFTDGGGIKTLLAGFRKVFHNHLVNRVRTVREQVPGKIGISDGGIG